MPKTYASIWLHAIWSTRLREPVLDKSFRYKLFHHMKRQGIQKHIHIDIINGIEDHVHCLFRLMPSQSPSNLIRNIKGESSHWINEQKLTKEKFRWQEGYGIYSVSQKEIEKVRSYIYKQESHHRTIDYEKEIRLLV